VYIFYRPVIGLYIYHGTMDEQSASAFFQPNRSERLTNPTLFFSFVVNLTIVIFTENILPDFPD